MFEGITPSTIAAVLILGPVVLFSVGCLCLCGYMIFRAAIDDMKEKDMADYYDERWKAVPENDLNPVNPMRGKN